MIEPKVICPYCNKEAEWIENSQIYGKNYGKSYMCYYCQQCDAYVGCHKNSRIPLGTMANKELRELRRKTHERLDSFWKNSMLSRREFYHLLKKIFGREIHIGECNIEQCEQLIDSWKLIGCSVLEEFSKKIQPYEPKN